MGVEHWEGEKRSVRGWVGLSVLVIAAIGECSVEKSLSWKETEMKSRHCAVSSYHLPVDHERGDN